jgi:hypothetical protein
MAAYVANAGDLPPSDQKVASKKVTGRLLDAQQGDYFHASVRAERGSDVSFYVDDEICFLVLNQKEVMVIEYDEIKRFFPEGSGYYPANIIQSISTKAGQKRWVRKENVAPTLVQWHECARDLLILSNSRRGND